VIRPVEELTQGMTEIHRGNLDYQLPPVSSHDELSDLAESFDTLRAQLRSSRIENDELQKRTHSLAILEERDRLAREMHDNLAQTLGYINLKAAMADSELVLRQTNEARASLLELKRAAKEAYTDVRESIFNLRNAPTSGDGLLAILTNSLTEYRAQCGIEVQLYIADERLAEFPVEVQVQVNRIIQEALTNVRKHSGASCAAVRFGREDGHIQIQIEDNGKGFDPNEIKANGSGHYGLQIMRERAESVGGELEIDSEDGVGTRVTLLVPIYPIIEDPHERTTYLAS
jgi:nitrate/nitrite-specific signal transduction histidine kinase